MNFPSEDNFMKSIQHLIATPEEREQEEDWHTSLMSVLEHEEHLEKQPQVYYFHPEALRKMREEIGEGDDSDAL